MNKSVRLALYLFLTGIVFFHLQSEEFLQPAGVTESKVLDATVTSSNGAGLSINSSSDSIKHFEDVEAELETDSRQTVDEQIAVLKALNEENPGMLSSLVQKDMAVKGKLKEAFDENRYFSFEQQLSEVEQLLASFSLSQDEQFFYARYYFLRHKKEQDFETEKALASHFLSDEAASRVIDSINKREQQLLQREQYQNALHELKLELDAHRVEKFPLMSETEWQAYKQEQIKSFKQAFFENKP